MKRRYIPLAERTRYHRLEDVVGCKWSCAVIAAIGEGVKRPGALERHVPGISKKVLAERLRKLLAFGLIRRTAFGGLPARVDYDLTPAGEKLLVLLGQLRELNGEMVGEERPQS